ncbi:21 kDa protein-like [Oryza brachyantha]|uniref:21 kDa protein-like n=1 Tax=Oryza brachyantha TaxID=4533 RepID=UPI001ADA7B61|nr:21 kDa protein-like [Oryza brachyantha]
MARISLSLLLAVACCCCLAVAAVVSAGRPAPAASTKAADADADAGPSSFVRTWCAGTAYPALCGATLAPYAAAVGESPARLAWAALTVTLAGARNATSAMRSMAAGAGGRLPPAAAQAAGDCVSMLGDGEDALRQCVDAMARVGEQEGRREAARQVRFEVDSVLTWASAALTDGDMCMEGFKGEAAGGGGTREAVRGHVMGLVHLTANALAIVNTMSKHMTP